MKNKRVLIISVVGLIYDGITSVMLSYLKAMDLSDIDVYVAATIRVEGVIQKQFQNIGCNIINFHSRKAHTVTYFFELVKFIKKYRIDVVHVHGNSGTMAVEMVAAWLGGCKVRIAHSHNTRCDQIKADKILRPIFNLFYTDALACGKDAGKWLFKNRSFIVLKNGRNIQKYAYSGEARNRIRAEFQIGDCRAIGHVGGFVPQKNHVFLMSIYKELLKKEPSVKLFVVGDGLLKEDIINLCKEYGIYDQVVFTGNIDNMSEFLSAMDAMVLPSLFEGLPLVTVEWQINGLPCLVSDSITKECAFTEFIEFESLDKGAEEWAKELLNIAKSNRSRNSRQGVEQAMKAGYDIKENATLLKKYYMQNPSV